MKRAAPLLAVLALCLATIVSAQAPKTGAGPEQALMDLERAWAATAVKSDAVALDAILADNWTGTSVEGKVTTRAQSLDDTKKSKFTKSEVSEMKVVMLNPTAAVATGVWTGVGTGPKGEKIDTTERWTDVFANQGGKWKAVASQSTTIKK